MKPSENRYKKIRSELLKRSERTAYQVSRLYDEAITKISRQMLTIDFEPDKPFSFEEYGLQDKVDSIMDNLADNIYKAVSASVVNEFKVSEKNVAELLKEIVPKQNIEKQVQAEIFSHVRTSDAVKSVMAKMPNVSQRVWNGATLGQMETAVQEAMLEGMPAKQMATLMKKYLNEPDNFFRRFRIKTGESETGESIYGRQWKKRIQQPDGTYKWKDCKPSDYPAGEGVYHSSYKNALRMARTHTNIAYRTADYNTYQSTPFVIGIEIRISNNHTTKTSKGVVPLEDICDRLAGKYPKDFKWTGWHPNCRCYQIPILATQEETDKMIEDILEGGDGSNVECDNEIKELPKNFLDWLKDNENRIVEANSLPYFLTDNATWVSNALGNSKQRQQIFKQYINYKGKDFVNPLDNKLAVDVTGGIATTAVKGITALIKRYYEAEANAEKIELLKQMVADKNFKKLDYHSTKDNSIFGMGMQMFDKKLKEGEMPANLSLAKKFVAKGYDVYMLHNPKNTRSADYILRKDNKLYYTEGKFLTGKNSLDHKFYKEQSERISIDVMSSISANYVSSIVKTAFEQYSNLKEVILFKGSRMIKISYDKATKKKFDRLFRQEWNLQK